MGDALALSVKIKIFTGDQLAKETGRRSRTPISPPFPDSTLFAVLVSSSNVLMRNYSIYVPSALTSPRSATSCSSRDMFLIMRFSIMVPS